MVTMPPPPEWVSKEGTAVRADDMALLGDVFIDCTGCGGQGEIGIAQDYWGNWVTETCRKCKGYGVEP